MFVIYDKDNQIVPIKVWLGHKSQLDSNCLKQAMNLANLPYVHHHIGLSSDCHLGYGMPIGGIMATNGVVVPNAVGKDIGCGVRFCLFDIKWEDIKNIKTKDGQDIRKAILSTSMRNIPVGFNHHKVPQEWTGFSTAPIYSNVINQELDSARYQLGTLGSGNHFLECQVDKEGRLALMLHSGSRNLGSKICDYYNNTAKILNERWHTKVPSNWDLAFLPIKDKLGKEYMEVMNFALDFAKANRALMMERAKNIVLNMLKKYGNIGNVKILLEHDIHHNYAAWEHHFGKNVIVHRKGATRVREGEIGIIPGSMGTSSYIVEGKGNPESFHSCSHGAGRALGRREAKRRYSTQHVVETMKKLDIVLLTPKKTGIAEECIESYKDIEDVMHNQNDLVKVTNKLRPIGVLKA